MISILNQLSGSIEEIFQDEHAHKICELSTDEIRELCNLYYEFLIKQFQGEVKKTPINALQRKIILEMAYMRIYLTWSQSGHKYGKWIDRIEGKK